eukprot:scaffold293505_cov31-Tisochrysis_lutea.AAC.2
MVNHPRSGPHVDRKVGPGGPHFDSEERAAGPLQPSELLPENVLEDGHELDGEDDKNSLRLRRPESYQIVLP